MKKYRVLVLYHKHREYRIRKTIDEHLYAFRNYVDHVDFHYFNAAIGIPGYLRLINYDGIILHYTILANRWNTDFFHRWRVTTKNLALLKGYKVAIPQDEYAETDLLCEMLNECGVESVFTCFSEEDFDKAYPPSKVPLKKRITVLTGYIDESAVTEINKLCEKRNSDRQIDIGYRARKLPYWLGIHGQIKYRIGEIFLEKTNNDGMSVDISNDPNDVFLGMDWYRFLCRCRVVLGCEGGASLMDPTGNIRVAVENYVADHPNAQFEEVEDSCFKDKDNNIRLFTVSPRHFECAITRTCQALIEGSYAGIFKPGRHYIEIKKDYSNIDEVLEKIKDKAYCEKIADNAYRDIVLSGDYTYRRFANLVVAHIIQNANQQRKRSVFQDVIFLATDKFLKFRERLEPILVKVFYLWLAVRLYRMGIFKEIWRRLHRK